MNIYLKSYVARREAETVFEQEIRAELQGVKKRLITGIRSRMREDLGDEKRNVSGKVSGAGYRLSLVVSGDLPQTLVDEYSRPAGSKMPPWGPGTKLFGWVGRHFPLGASSLATKKHTSKFERRTRNRKTKVLRTSGQSLKARQASLSFLVARKIARDGIPAKQPFQKTIDAERQSIGQDVENAIARGVDRLNKL